MSAEDTLKDTMGESVPFADTSAMVITIRKWGLEGEADGYRAGIMAILLENQSKVFQRLEDDGLIPDDIEAKFGADWREAFYSGMKRAWRAHPLPNLCSIQPMTAPRGGLAHYKPHDPDAKKAETWAGLTDKEKEESASAPEVRIDIAITEVRAESRKSRIQFSPSTVLDRIIDGVDNRATLLDMAFEEMLTEVGREILGALYHGVLDAHTYCEATADDLLTQVHVGSQAIFEASHRAPANNLIGNDEMLRALGIETGLSNGQIQKVGTLSGRWNVYLDPLFPKKEVLLWYQGQSFLNTAIIYAPYHTEFSKVSDVEGYASRNRHKILLVRPELAYVVKLRSADQPTP